MDWLYFARTDFQIYQDPARIRNYVTMGKITETDFTEITGEAY